MNSFKKISIRTLIIFYGFSYLLQNTIFVDRKKVYAAENPSTTNLVAVFVDKNIYQDIKTNLIRYTTTYIQKKIANSKAVVFPIDTKTMKAHEISQILENMYFEGIKNESSKLVGTILIGDIPLPVVENKGFVYPSIYPYVDFEEQQFIYDSNKNFFVSNNNPNGQAELRHGIIKFEKNSEYTIFFNKVKSYYTNPTTFIDKAIWYDDFIGTKKYFIPENTKYYVNSLLFSEDIGYHRFNNLLLNTLKDEHNESTLALGTDLKNDLQDTEDADLQAYADDIAERNENAATQDTSSAMPTLTLKKATQEMLKGYDGLISAQFLSKIRDNVASLARRYKTTEGETFTDYSSTTDKIAQKDNRVVGDIDNEIQPLLIQINDVLESGLNNKIEQEKYYMTTPIPVSELDFEGKKKGTIQKKCTRKTYNYYENYYFGKNANEITSAEDTSIYKGTFQNLTTISGQTITNPLQSIGGSYDIFSTQIEANRGYDFSSTQEELERYAKYKTNKQSLRQLKCTNYFLGRERLNICLRPRSRTKDDSANENKCNIQDTEQQGGCESLTGFAARNRGGASPMNINATTQKLNNYNYQNAVLPIYNIAGAKKIDTAQPQANSYKGIETYTTMIQKKFGVGDLQYGGNNVLSLIANPTSNGSDTIFTNQLPTGNGLHPTWINNPPKTYTQTNFFTQFTLLPSHIVYRGKAVLYKVNPGECGGNGSIYTYKTIDSRIKNISPTRDQISNTDFYKFKDSSDLEVFYNGVMKSLIQTKNDITKTNTEVIGTTASNATGIVTNLNRIKTIISSGNNGLQNITTFNPATLLSYNQTQILNKANQRSGENLNPAKMIELSGRIATVNDGLESLLNYIGSLNINDTTNLFTSIIQSENLKNQKVELLDTWKSNITQNLDYITSNINTLKTTFTQARAIYNSISSINNSIVAVQAQKTAIGLLHGGAGCGPTHYKPICDVLTNVITTLQNYRTNINDKIDKIHQYPGDTNENGVVTTVKPFVEINQIFGHPEIATEITQTKTTMNTFDISTDANKKEKHKGMNLTTQDRPIDNIRNITFQGIGGDLVKLNYPNLYEVEIYKIQANKKILKTPTEIREAIKTYLLNKATEYNNILTIQKNKKNQYYQTWSSQFTFLGQVDPLANPNTHNYNLLPADYFITQTLQFLDTLKNGYGEKYVYGKSPASTSDEKLDVIAKLLYYQNITWPERLQQTGVAEDMTEIKSSFDVNQKVSSIVATYLTENNDQGKFITPTYNTTGYEIGFINSDGEDYISAKTTPAFIQSIQNIQETIKNTPKIPANTFIEKTDTDKVQAEVNTCEGVDTQGAALLFDIKTFSSPWMKAMKCRIAKVLTKPFDIKIGFKNALGPVFVGTLKEIGNSLESAQQQRTEYGAQRNTPNNEETIANTDGEIQQKLQGYNNAAIVSIDKAIIAVDSTTDSQLKIGMAQNLGDVNVKISGTGDNCVGISRNGKVLSENICTRKAQEYYNPNTENYLFDIVVKQKKAGTTAIKIELCPGIGNACIVEQQIINILPGPIENITIQSPTNIVMAGGEVPLIINASDKFGNTIGQNTQAYTISVNSGDGKIYDGASANTSIKFDNFLKAGFVYQAPIDIQANKGITITVTPDNQKLLTNTGSNQSAQKKLIVAKGIVTISDGTGMLYTTNTSQQQLQQQKITYTLPKDESDIQFQDLEGIAQITSAKVGKLRISVKDINGNALDTVANITSNLGLLKPGTLTEKNITATKKQTSFSPSNNFIIKDGVLDIALYANFKAGNDTITINIPGLDPIIIPVVVHPGEAKTVLLTIEKKRLDLSTTTESKGTIHVVDTRNNTVTTPTAIKLGVIGAGETNVTEFMYSGSEYTYTVTAKKPGGEGYVFGYIKNKALSDQVPGYEKLIVQESLIPKEKLNVMYLNLFGTDRGNQRGYFSENDKVVNSITNKSNKLLATTTELVDPSKIKQIEYIINPNGQIQSISDKATTLTIENKKIVALLPEIAKIYLGNSNDFTIKKVNSGTITTFQKNANTILYMPEATDSIITGNDASSSKITINGNDVLDINNGTIDPNIVITSDNETLNGITTYTITFNGKNIGKLLIWNNDTITTNTENVQLQDPIVYGTTKIFSEGSTNTEGIGIYLTASAFTKQGYASIEDSADSLAGIGFTSDFKNVSNFANGKSVGEATLPYGSQFLINFGDPLLQRRDKNTKIPNTDFDAAIGQTIYADPNKTIFKILPIDFNKDGLKDLIVVYTDGVIKLVKNYGGTDPYKNLQELMIIADTIKDIKIGDVDGNGYDDILITTNNNKGIVYLNDKGIFAVDGKTLCLNINTEPGTKNPTPDDFSQVKQFFVEDMDKDGKLDIVTNDSFNDIKIFYGGSTNNGANYLSSTTGTCDANRYTRQQTNYKTIKRFGIKVNSDRHIQDESLVHRKGVTQPVEGTEEETDVEAPDTTANMSEEQMEAFKDQTLDDIKNMANNNDTYIAAGSTQLAYVDNPLSTAPSYETLDANEITYLPIRENNNAVSVYKEYVDINGGVLRKNDEVVIKTTIISKKNNNKLTYIDQTKGPRSIAKDNENKINGFVFTSGNTGSIQTNRNAPEGYQFVLDNIQLNSGAAISFSYTVKYTQETQATRIVVEDQDLAKASKLKDTYPDVATNSTDACQKNRIVFFNEKTGNKRTYEQVYDNIQSEIDSYNSGANTTQQTALQGIVDQLGSITSLDSVSSLPGMATLETWTTKNILSSLFSQDGLSVNINTNFIDTATAKVSKKIDAALQGLCQGFTLGKGGSAGCSGVPVPFNQAFLAPGDYHIFGCVPKAPNPLAAVFSTLNKTLGKGIPVLTIPANIPNPVAPGTYIPIPGIFGMPFKGSTDGFLLGVQGGPSAIPSQFRLYIVPTLTLGLGMAMCFGPYSVGTAVPKPFRDLGGNCIVFALPPLTTCTNATGSVAEPTTESLGSSMISAAGQGTCNNPPKIGNTIAFAGDTTDTNTNNSNGEQIVVSTASSPFQLVAAGSSQNNPSYSAAIPQGNFGGLVSIDQDPIQVSASEDYGNATQQLQQTTNYEGYTLEKGPKIDLKILGAKTKGLVKCMVQDRSTRQIKYIQNNLTKMTIQVDLPDLTTIVQGFDKIDNLSETYNAINTQDEAEGYISDTNGQGIGTGRINEITKVFSKQQRNNISQKIGQNPFEAIQQMFSEVPLVNIDTKDINLKIPALTSDDVNKYSNYLKIRGEKADAIGKNWEQFFTKITAMCNIKELKDQIANAKNIQQEVATLENIKKNGKLSTEQKASLDKLTTVQKQIEICLKVSNQSKQYLSFRENSAGLIKSVKQNINVLEKYKEFPTQLYERTHISDRYLTELSSLLGDYIGGITSWTNTNANRFSQYVDAITLIVGSIKTWQAVIDFSVNRSEKCSKCSNDNYGSFSCSLSFLCPKLPIFPIPAFKIPNVYMDLSHVELGMNIILPKINFVPVKVPLPQLPNLPEPPSVEVDWDILYGLNINFFKDMSLPTIPVIPEPPTLPEPPSFIPSIKMDLPVLPPAPKIPKIIPEIKGILKVATFIGKVFCIVKGGIGLVGEKGVKGKVEQITQRTWNVPVFDYFNLTTKFKDPPLQGFDYQLDAYTTLKFNFDGVYDVFNSIAQTANGFTNTVIEAPIQKAVDRTTDKANNNALVTGILNPIEDFDQNINFNSYHSPKEDTGMLEYKTAYNELKQGLLLFKNSTLTDKKMHDNVKTILATIENKSTILPANTQIEQVEKASKKIINEKIQENKDLQKQIKNYDSFIKSFRDKTILVDAKTTAANFSAPLLTIDGATKQLLDNQEDPTKTYLELNKNMVQGYLDAVNNDSAEKLNMSKTVYKNSKAYLETTKDKIDTALLAYNDTPLLAQTTTCTNCSSTTSNNNYSTDISAYVQGVFVESYSGNQKNMINTITSPTQSQNVEQTYTTNIDLNNDRTKDILMYDNNSIYVKYGKQQTEQVSAGGNSLATYYTKFYSYESEHFRNRAITSLQQLKDNSDEYGYITIDDITIKVVDKNKEVKNFKTDGQSFDNLQLSRKNSKIGGEAVDGYIIKVSTKIDEKDTPNSFRSFLGIGRQDEAKYIVVLPKDSDYKKSLLTIEDNLVKKSINLELGDTILAVEYYDPESEKITLSLKELPRKWLYTSIATLTSSPDQLSSSQRNNNIVFYKKSSPRSNQTVAGLQNLGDITAPVGEVTLWRNLTSETISTGVVHEGFINTSYTLKSLRTDNVIVSKMIIQKDGQIILEKDNQSQTGTIDIGGLFFTGTTQQQFDFIAIDQNNNIAKQTVTVNIRTPDIEILDVKKTGDTTADIVAKISNDLDEGIVIFQRLRNGVRNTIDGSNQNSYGGFNLAPKQTLITGGIFTMGNTIGLYDNQGKEIATIDPKTGELKITQGLQTTIKTYLNFSTHIPVLELRDTTKNTTVFQIVLPIEGMSKFQMNTSEPSYKQLLLQGDEFGAFNNGYCIKNTKNDCIVYTNNAGSIYVPGIYANSLVGEYAFNTTTKQPIFVIKDQSNTTIATLTLQIKSIK